jgi:nitronate monooxygenase
VTLRTRLTEKLAIKHPVLLAPMGNIAGGRLAGAVSEAGGLGLIGGGYGDRDWLEREFAATGNRRVGCGFISSAGEIVTRLVAEAERALATAAARTV